ncbi:MAG: bifunctional hydroxymethylpyrimidine kinase/phosphomethylpyrimidine kinase [Acidobacteriaceae bacterium]|nr:bifunctional hydroxymethylpyrimidine kinase/phosphomethylpyrimidine kinase [Acidobacteriaceae bacterium]
MPTVALTIAGSDPCGGAGIQADLKTFHQFGVYGEAVVTLLTVQNTRTVPRVETVPHDFVAEQIEAVINDIPPDAAKTGALGSVEIVEAVAELARDFEFPLVIDPVMMSKHGARLASRDAEEALKRLLLGSGRLVTPNIPEAESLTGMQIETESDIREAAARLLDLGATAVLIKGGHLSGDPIDFLLDEDGFTRFTGRRIDTPHTHGTGCAYSAAITACLALNYELREAISTARSFVENAIATAPHLGGGQGPINHFAHAAKAATAGYR